MALFRLHSSSQDSLALLANASDGLLLPSDSVMATVFDDDEVLVVGTAQSSVRSRTQRLATPTPTPPHFDVSS